MIGNAAVPILTIYLLYMGYEKNKFIGTAAWFFLVVNLIKLPFHIIVFRARAVDGYKSLFSKAGYTVKEPNS